MLLSMLKALLIRFLMSLSAPPTFVTILPRYVNYSVVLRALAFTWIVGCGFVMLKAMTSDFFWLIVKPICWAKLQRRDDFSCICCCVWDNNARSSAKSKSSRKEKRVHLMPLFWSSVV